MIYFHYRLNYVNIKIDTFLKGGFHCFMKPKVKRCLTFVLCALFLSASIIVPAKASSDLPLNCEFWNYTMIYGEEELSRPDVIIIYLHGDNSTGTEKEHLERLATIEHPLKYARADELPLPDNVLFVCPQAKYDGQFRTEQLNLEGFILFISMLYPDAKVILAGASHGCLAAYNVAAAKNEDIDAYVFISGIRPTESKKLPLLRNCMVVFGDEVWLSKRGDYSNLFNKINITDSLYARESLHWEEETNNLYVRGRWHHGNSPLVFTEDFFWEWVNNISVE